MRLPVDGLQGRTLPSSVRFADSFPRGGSLLAVDFFACVFLLFAVYLVSAAR